MIFKETVRETKLELCSGPTQIRVGNVRLLFLLTQLFAICCKNDVIHFSHLSIKSIQVFNCIYDGS